MAGLETEKLSQIDDEIRDHPERFEDDIPSMKFGSGWEGYNAEMDKRRPAWLKERIAATQKGSAEA